MKSRVSRRLTLRIAVVLTICTALFTSSVPLLVTEATQGQGQREEHKPKPKAGKPEGELPDLEDVKQESLIEREPAPPIPSTIHSPRNSGKPWDGRRVGDPEPNGTERGNAGSDPASNAQRTATRRSNQTRRAHARARMPVPPPPHDQFVQNFFNYALVRSPYSEETNYWYDQLRVAYATGSTSLKLAGIELGRTLFESAEYAARNRDNHWYVYDLYKTYLMREPDAGGWAMWEGLVPTHGREYVRRGFEESGEFATLSANITTTGSPSSNKASLISAQVEPRNQPGGGMLTRDVSWSVPLLTLPGRAGLDLGLTLSYSSQVWTRSGPYIYFDDDNGFPSPGFRLGFPTVQRKVFDAQTAKNAYLIITPSGRRVELRHVSGNTYDSADSSYLRLIEDGALLRVYSTDGTRMTFMEANGEYRCVEIKDRNGNYITVLYNALGRITNITDTLGRVITFNYDGNSNLMSITQSWAGQPSHQWVSFGWDTRTMQYSFSDSTLRGVIGTKNGTVLPVITQVNLNDTSHFTFNYTNSLQLSEVRNFFGATERNATVFTFETPVGDAPRLTDSRVSARNWTGVNGVPSQVITTYSVAGDGACVRTTPDGTIYKEYYGTGYQRGLTTLSEVWSGGVKVKWTTMTWTQDNTGVDYEVNPRVTETNVYDAGGNRRRTTIDYGPYAQWGLPYAVMDYAADGVTPIRNTITDYNLSQVYLDRRIIGLVSALHQTDIGSWQRKVGYTYDDPARLHSVPAAATQHDSSYNTSFTARGNVTAVSRWDVNDIVNPAKALIAYTNYYTTGTRSSATDSSGHQSSLTYSDSFSDSVNRNTFAYPTTITDENGFSSTMQYNFDFGATTRTQSPTPAGQSQGAIQTMTYNSLGQLERITTTNNNAYKRFWYGLDFTASYSTVNNVADENYAIQVTDGAGRVIGASGNHPGSSGGHRLINIIYNQMGRAWKQSNPTEVNSSWVPSGADAAGMYYTQQTYDWQGRPLVTTNPDGTTKEASYAGCGCAGGSVVTLTDEGTVINFAGTIKKRQQKIYSDVLDRTRKVEILNWDGSGPNGTAPGNSVYSTTVNTYNARDQITQIRQYAGTEGSGTYQTTTMNYDGYGRLQSKQVPSHTAATVYTYNADDTIQTVTDARGATATYGYNARHLLTSINYSAPGGITPTASVTLGYDAAGNRTSMADGVGTRSYNYDQLSRMSSESQTFTGFAGSYALTYGYNFADQLTSLAEPSQFGVTVSYTYDTAGRLNAVNGSGGISAQLLTGIQYRAWGGRKHATYGDGPQVNVTHNSRLLPTRYELTNVYIAPLITPGYYTVGTDNQYHPDGRLRYADDLQDDHYDRAFTFDHAGRFKEAYTGREARGLAPTWPEDSAYRQSYSYDVWNNMGRTGRHWTLAVSDTPTYTNNRRPDWTYDASGNVTLREGGQKTHGYDAAGHQRDFYEAGTDMWGSYWLWHQYTINQTYDGDGRPGKRIETRYSEDENGPVEDSTATSYQLRSSVLGGALIAEINQWGGREGYVYAEGEIIATYAGTGAYTFTSFQHRNLTTGQWIANGVRTELDPLGADVGYTSPYAYNMTYSDIMGSDNLYSIRGNALDIRGGCTMDGMSVACNEAMEAVRSGTAQEVVLVSHYVTAKLNGQIVFRGYVGVSQMSAADMWRSEITTPVNFTPEQLIEHADKFKLQSFWAGMLNGGINFNTSYAETTYSDDVGTHDVTTPYTVNIYGGAAYIGGPQDPLPTPVASPRPTPPKGPRVKPCDKNGVKYNQEEYDDLANNLGGQITYTKPGKPDSEALITDVEGNPTFQDFEKRLAEKGWSPIYMNLTPAHWGGNDWKRTGKFGNWYHITVFWKLEKHPRHPLLGPVRNLTVPPTRVTIHCENGNPQDPFHER